jgi:2-methylcitrate dehydratase PrpD
MQKMERSPGATEQLATRAANIGFGSLDQPTITRAKQLLLDHLGCLLIGSTLPWTKIVHRYMTDFSSGNNDARVVNYGSRLAMHDAAYVNAVFAQGHELDDYSTRNMGGGHGGAGTWPVALAIGERLHASGQDILGAVVAGYECMYRVGWSVRPASDSRGHHVQGILSPFGAAATAGRLLGLPQQHMTMALSLAASHCAGINEFGTTGGEVKRIHAGNGVRGGMQSAFLAQRGYTGPPTALEGHQGFCHVYSNKPKVGEITKTTDHFAIMESGIKLHPMVGTALSSIETMTELVDKYGFAYGEIDQINAAVAVRAAEHGGLIFEPKDVASAQFSIPFGIALRAVVGSNDLSHYMDEALWKDSRIAEVARRVTFTAAPEADGDERHYCRLTVTLKNGQKHQAIVRHVRGSFLNPLTQDEVEEKFARLAERVVGSARVSQLIDAVNRVDRMKDVNELVDLLCLG